ncbi:hypothetical protein KR093_007088 [Drosophila rubida]|uniref:Phosphatidic acid phosphatase type 2/haloperoxidase domain-containing protein n=1 Tax=Drosophila rubida TaxID=30044 RepID=A0AAD4K0L4_9MUSC|nr:hypothetical protein KR093_007088 [Drosophila rubida]
MRDEDNATGVAPSPPPTLTPPPTTTATATATSAQRRLTRRFLVELAIVTVLVIPICICEVAIEPVRRGFFCDDDSIRYPFHENTVTPVMLGLLVGALPLLVLVLVEYVHSLRAGELARRVQLGSWQLAAWYVELGRQFAYFGFGMLLTFDATELGKYTIGRLRPHFYAVCQPQLSDGTLCSDASNRQRYVEDYECAGEGYTAADVRQARLSFPSGHSSLAFYALLYVALYLQRKLSWRSSKLARHFLQFLLLMLAWYTALSRVMDSWHHWSDVLAGSLIGVAGALLTAHYIAHFFATPYAAVTLGSGLRREDTSATLQEEVCPATPPPYCVNDDRYCTKV